MIARTQIGGKYHKNDNTLFRLKQALQSVNIAVTHPMANEIVYSNGNQGFAFDPAKYSFHAVEVDYYKCIAASDFHTVNNRFLSDLGYIGDSASLEVLYAMLHNKPILLMHTPILKRGLDKVISSMLMARCNLLHIKDLSKCTADEILSTALSLKGSQPNYQLNATEQSLITKRVSALLREIRES